MKEAMKILQMSIFSVNYHGWKEMITIEWQAVIKMVSIRIRMIEAGMME